MSNLLLKHGLRIDVNSPPRIQAHCTCGYKFPQTAARDILSGRFYQHTLNPGIVNVTNIRMARRPGRFRNTKEEKKVRRYPWDTFSLTGKR